MQSFEKLGLPEKLSESDTGAIVRNVIFFLGASLVFVVLGTIFLSWFDKNIPEVLVVLAGLLGGGLVSTITKGVSSGE